MIHKSCLQLLEDTTAVACRALWRVKEDDINLAKNYSAGAIEAGRQNHQQGGRASFCVVHHSNRAKRAR